MAKEAFGGNTAITVTLNSLANASARQAAAVDNSSNLYLDAQVTVTAAVGTVSAGGSISVYAAGSIDGTTWPGEGSANNDGVTGSDAAITLESPTNLTLIGVINTPTSSKTYVSQPISVAAAFNNVLPRNWTIIVLNNTGAAFSASGCSAHYNGVFVTQGGQS